MGVPGEKGDNEKEKNMSSDLLAGFGRQLTGEDISTADEGKNLSSELSIAKEVMPVKEKTKNFIHNNKEKGQDMYMDCG